jgi:hypothetical protein
MLNEKSRSFKSKYYSYYLLARMKTSASILYTDQSEYDSTLISIRNR